MLPSMHRKTRLDFPLRYSARVPLSFVKGECGVDWENNFIIKSQSICPYRGLYQVPSTKAIAYLRHLTGVDLGFFYWVGDCRLRGDIFSRLKGAALTSEGGTTFFRASLYISWVYYDQGV